LNLEPKKQTMWDETTAKLTTKTYTICAATHIGLKQKCNEDRFVVRQLKDDSILLAVADGLGGNCNGDRAAEIVRHALSVLQEIPDKKEKSHLVRLARELDRNILHKANDTPQLKEMGSTLLVVLIRNGIAHWVHVGDSRMYLLRQKRLQQITEDQTLARFLVAEGEITPEQVPTHYSRHAMDQCIGCGICEPETGRIKLLPNDIVMLTTDGLHKEVEQSQITALLNDRTGIKTKTDALVQAALASGGNDNVTVIIAGKDQLIESPH
jgi:PPM family protein phosphatase